MSTQPRKIATYDAERIVRFIGSSQDTLQAAYALLVYDEGLHDAPHQEIRAAVNDALASAAVALKLMEANAKLPDPGLPF